MIFRTLIFARTLFIAFCLTMELATVAQSNEPIKWTELAPIPDPTGYNGSFSGVHNDAFIVIGGANFPDKPVHEGGSKQYHSRVHILTEIGDEARWVEGEDYPHRVAYGAQVSLKQGLLCIGGTSEDQDFRDVHLVTWNGTKIELEKWPDLPYTMKNMAATLAGNRVYVVGGEVTGKPANKMFFLDLDEQGLNEFGWKEGPDFPGPARIMPVAVGQNSKYAQHVYLFSGSSYPDHADEPFVNTDGYEFNPATEVWSRTADIDPYGKGLYSLHGASGIAMGAHHIMLIGGVNKDRFSDALKLARQIQLKENNTDTSGLNVLKRQWDLYLNQKPEWYEFNEDILLYHTISDTWTIADTLPFPGVTVAGFEKWKDGWIVAGGETKPGIRTNKVYYGRKIYDPEFGIINWSVLIVYMTGMLYLGFFFMKKEAGTEDFFKGGGRIPWWAAGMSIFATMLSAITFMAVPAFAYASDWKRLMMAVTILIMAYPVVRYYLPFFRRLNVTTAYEYLEHRFNYTTRLLASIIFIIFMVARMAIVLFLPSLALTTVTGIDIYICIIMMGLITIVYCTMGGVEAVIWGDVIQGFVLLGGALLSVVYLVNGTEGGLGRIIELSIEYEKMETFDFTLSLSSATFWVVFFGGMANNLITYSSDQAIIQRYMTTSSEKAAGKSIIFNGIMSIVVSLVFYFIGTAMFGYYKTHPHMLNYAMERTDSIFPYYIMTHLPVGIVGLLIAAIFAATMSTVSTNINSLSTAFTVDIYSKIATASSDKRRLWVARLSGIVLGGLGIVIALLMATWSIQSLYDYFQYVLGLLSSGLGGLFLIGIFFPRIRTKSALIGFVGGLLFLYFVSTTTEVDGLMYGFVGMVSTVIIAWIFSYLIKEPVKDIDQLTVKSLK